MTRVVTATARTQRHTVRAQVSPAVIQVAQRNLYELAKDNGFPGTFAEFLDSLKPPMTWASTNW